MRIRYDAKVDALYIRLDDSKVVESDEVKPGVVLDFNANKQVVGIEVLDPAKAAEHSMSLSRYISEVLRKELRHSREYQEAMQRCLAEKPASLKRPGEGYLTREEANDRPGLRRR